MQSQFVTDGDMSKPLDAVPSLIEAPGEKHFTFKNPMLIKDDKLVQMGHVGRGSVSEAGPGK